MSNNRRNELITRLQSPGPYQHETNEFDLVETHISWVILTGPYAYKIKKPVDMEFLDFSTLPKRKRFCEEEVRLNRRTAPDLYQGVVPITGSPQTPHMNGSGKPFEYAVKMRQLDPSNLLHRVVKRGDLDLEHALQLGTSLASFHRDLPPCPTSKPYGQPRRIRDAVQQNFQQIGELLPNSAQPFPLREIEEWSNRWYRNHESLLRRRKQQGRVRECHGDLHLKNMYLDHNTVRFFDCIEFNEDFRWIDVMNELACPVVDLDLEGLRPRATRLINEYLHLTGDYEGVHVLRFYLVYRAMVKAKVGLFQAGDSLDPLPATFRNALQWARRYIQPSHPVLLLTHGLSASGKTFLAEKLQQSLRLFHLQSDVVRKQLHDLEPGAETDSPVGAGIYSDNATRRTYQRLAQLTRRFLTEGESVLVDASFLDHRWRKAFYNLADQLDVPVRLLDCRVEHDTLRRRIREREATKTSVSEAGLEVLEHQRKTHDPLRAEEQHRVIEVDMEGSFDAETVLRRIPRTGFEHEMYRTEP